MEISEQEYNQLQNEISTLRAEVQKWKDKLKNKYQEELIDKINPGNTSPCLWFEHGCKINCNGRITKCVNYTKIK